MTETPLTITPAVYRAFRGSEYEISNCEDLFCVAIGTKDPVQSEKQTRSKGTICPNATNSGGVHFMASKDELYFVHVDVTAIELSGFEVISHVTESITSSSSHSLNSPSRWLTIIGTLLLFGW